jgi:hypothetical protein
MEEMDMTHITEIPMNTRGLVLHLVSNVDIDLHLLDVNTRCLAGYACDNDYGNTTHNGMNIFFSGDDTTDPVDEWIRIDHVTEPLTLKVVAYVRGEGIVTYSWDEIRPCLDLNENSRMCECPQGQFYDRDGGCVEYDACQDYPCEDCGRAFCPLVGERSVCEELESWKKWI